MCVRALRHEKQFWLHLEFPLDVLQGIVDRADEAAGIPELDHGRFITRGIGADH
nr:hypothetical protein [Verrucomicrobium spinosum]